MAPTELAQELLTSGAGITKRIKKLVEEGLVERRVNPVDGRGALVHITPRAQSAILPILESVWAFESELLSRITSEERAQLEGGLRSLLQVVEGPVP